MNNLLQVIGSVGILGVAAVILTKIFKKGGKNEAQAKSDVTNPDAEYIPSDRVREHIDDTVEQSTESALDSARKATVSNLEQIRSTARKRDSHGRFVKSN